MGKSKRRNKGRFAAYELNTVTLPAWKVLSFVAREVYNQLLLETITKSDAHNNNGRIGISARDMAERIGADRKTVNSAYAELQAVGFIIQSQKHSLGSNGMGRTTRWRLTLYPWFEGSKRNPATNEARNWTHGMCYPVEVHESSMARSFFERIGASEQIKTRRAKIQNPGPVSGPTPAQSAGHINPSGSGAMTQSAGHTERKPRPSERASYASMPCAIGGAWRAERMTQGEHLGWIERGLDPNAKVIRFSGWREKAA